MTHFQALRDIRTSREHKKPRGLAAVLGRFSGVDLVRKTLHRYEDGKRLKAYQAERLDLKTRHATEARTVDLRLRLQAQEAERKVAALQRVDRRELASFLRDERKDQRLRDRGDDDRMPSVARLIDRQPDTVRPPDLLRAFARQGQQRGNELPDLLDAFQRAANEQQKSDGSSGTLGPDDRPSGPSVPRGGGDSDRSR